MTNSRRTEPEQLVNYIGSLPDFKVYTQIDGNYGHVGATLADAVLQAANNYERTVRPRIERIRQTYARETNLNDLKRLLQRATAKELLNWNGRRAKTFLELVDLLDREGVDTEDDLRGWLRRDGSGAKLCNIRFIGPKTVDYLKILVGFPLAAMDRHLFKFLELAGIGKLNYERDYERGQEVVHNAADLMKLNRAHLDHSIWRYMSGSGATSQDRKPAEPECTKSLPSKAVSLSAQKTQHASNRRVRAR